MKNSTNSSLYSVINTLGEEVASEARQRLEKSAARMSVALTDDLFAAVVSGLEKLPAYTVAAFHASLITTAATPDSLRSYIVTNHRELVESAVNEFLKSTRDGIIAAHANYSCHPEIQQDLSSILNLLKSACDETA